MPHPKHLKTVLCIAAIFLIKSAIAENYYLSNTGNDANSGTSPSQAWKTLEKLNSFRSFKPGDSILFRRGDTFFGGFTINNSGTPAKPIVCAAYGSGDNPVISGFTAVDQWTNLGGNVWESARAVSGLQTCNMVTINNLNTPMGRTPNSDYFTFQAHQGKTSVTSGNLSGSTNWSGAEAVVRSSQWTLDRCLISSQSGNTIHFNHLTHEPPNGFGFFIQNHPKTLDVQNEWYYNPTTKKIQIYSVSKPSRVNVASTDNLVIVHGKYLKFDQLSFTGANSHAFYNDWGEIESPVIENCEISFSGIDAIKLAHTPNAVIANNRISHSNNIGIYFFQKAVTPLVKNNEIINTGEFAGMGQSGDISYIGIVSLVTGALIQNNKIAHSGYDAIYAVGDSFQIKNNLIDTFCTVLQDGGGIYTSSIEGVTYGKKIIGNIILNGIGVAKGTSDPELYASGIYLDVKTANIEVADNTVAYCSKGGLFLHDIYNVNVHDNTFYDNQFQLVTQLDPGNYHPFTGSSLKSNKYVSKLPGQLCAYLLSHNNNFSSWGILDNNYYARPLKKDFTIKTLAWNPYDERTFALSAWQSTFNYDIHSKLSAVTIPNYVYSSMLPNRFLNGTFANNINGISAWSTNGNLVASWNKENKIEQGSLQLSYSKPSTTNTSPNINIPIGKVDSAKQYVLRFSTIGNLANKTIYAYLRKTGAGYNELTSRIPAEVTTKRTDNEIVFSFPKSEATASIMFTWDDKDLNNTFWIDNIEIFEANISETNPDDHFRFEYNADASSKTVQLDGNYADVSGKKYSGKITLAAYSSLVLIRDTIKMETKAPIAIAGPDQTITLPTAHVDLFGSGTSVNSEISSYKWRKITGPTGEAIKFADSSKTTVTGLTQGIYLLELKVTDRKGLEGKDTLKVTVKPAGNVLPVANAGSDQTISLPTNTITLKGNGTDADGKIVTWLWTKISGPASYSIVNAASAVTDVNGLVAGIYLFELKITDDRGGVGKDTMKVTVISKANIPPVANAGVDQTITLPVDTIILKGNGSDADGKIETWLWTKISGPASCNIVNSALPLTKVSKLVEGVYMFELKVTDNNGEAGRDTLKVKVMAKINIPPVAKAGADQTITLPVNTILLNGSGEDNDGKIVSWLWTKISGPASFNIVNSVSPVTNVSNLVEGVYRFELKVMDVFGGVGKDTVQVKVIAKTNVKPVSNAGPDMTITFPVNSVILNGSGFDTDGTILSYSWLQISGPNICIIKSVNSAKTGLQDLIGGTYRFELTVTDNEGAIGKDTMSLTVALTRMSPEPLVIRFYPNPVEDIGILEINSKFTDKKILIILYNSLGEIMMKKLLMNSKSAIPESINMAGYPKGAYFLTVYIDQISKHSVKIIKQ